MSNLNLHPAWHKALGLQESAGIQLDTTSPWARTDLAQAVAVMTAASSSPSSAHHGWQAMNSPHRPGAPVGIKKQLGPGLWASSVASPNDARYPAEFLPHS